MLCITALHIPVQFSFKGKAPLSRSGDKTTILSASAWTLTHIYIYSAHSHVHLDPSRHQTTRISDHPSFLLTKFLNNFHMTTHKHTHTCRNSLKLSISENLNSNMRSVYILYISGSATSHCFYHQLIWLVLSWFVIWYSFRGATNRQKWSTAACMRLI